ncbi:MAG: TetR family transcriptional regulator [Flavobacterium sp. BFFFF2]|nr:MAG: TetR family transcriptional regulator [Flavobacterium sp. BFFFF2]
MEWLEVQMKVHPGLYVKDPETSTLGKKIIEHGLLLFDEVGYEAFTFKKLGERIASNESSVYRYFESKSHLLYYYSHRYWLWLEYRLVFSTTNISDPLLKLEKAIQLLIEPIQDDLQTAHLDEQLLHKIIVSEFGRIQPSRHAAIEASLIRPEAFNRIKQRLCAILQQVNPSYLYPLPLANTLIEAGHFQQLETASSPDDASSAFFLDLIHRCLK